MIDRPVTNQGLKQLVKQCHLVFQRVENTQYYSADDYQAAERKFVKYCLLNEAGQKA